MKLRKYTIFAFALLLCCGCGTENLEQGAELIPAQAPQAADLMEAPASKPADANTRRTVWMETAQPSYLPDITEIALTVHNESEDEVGFEAFAFTLFREENGAWVQVPCRGGDVSFAELAQICPPHKTASRVAPIADYYENPLPEGYYRISVGGERLTADFAVSADAPAVTQPAPQPSLSMALDRGEYQWCDPVQVTFCNLGDTDLDLLAGELRLESYSEGSASVTSLPDPESPLLTVPAGGTAALTVTAEMYGLTRWEPEGEYVLICRDAMEKFYVLYANYNSAD